MTWNIATLKTLKGSCATQIVWTHCSNLKRSSFLIPFPCLVMGCAGLQLTTHQHFFSSVTSGLQRVVLANSSIKPTPTSILNHRWINILVVNVQFSTVVGKHCLQTSSVGHFGELFGFPSFLGNFNGRLPTPPLLLPEKIPSVWSCISSRYALWATKEMIFHLCI